MIYMRGTLRQRLLNPKRRSIDPKTGCWNWIGNKNSKGYGMIWNRRKNKMEYVSKVSLRLLKNYRGTKCTLHGCDNPPCFNPDHLHPGTMSENIRESVDRKRHWLARKTECLRGHALEGGNVIWRLRGGRNQRECRKCADVRRRRWERINRYGWSLRRVKIAELQGKLL